MPILLDPPPLTRRARPLPAAGWFGVYLLVVVVGGALAGGWLLHRALVSETGFLFSLAEEYGPDRLVRRFQTVLAIVLAPWLLKKIGWRGVNDLGWNSDQTRAERKADFVRWFVIGLILMGGLHVLALSSGIREWKTFTVMQAVAGLVPAFMITGIGVGFLEETMTRGVLYRSMARVWTSWGGAVVSSGVFAWAHFLEASDASFLEGPFAVLMSSLVDEFAEPHTWLKFLNLFLFGLVLCRLVRQRGDIWAAVGLHASAVGAFKWFSRLTEINHDNPFGPLLGGHSSKFDDSWALVAVLTFLLVVNEGVHASRPAKPRAKV